MLYKAAITMTTSWQTEAQHLSCRWSEAGESVHYDSAWVQAAPIEDSATVPDSPFALSSFAGKDWFSLPMRPIE